jgi:hypothetical protein
VGACFVAVAVQLWLREGESRHVVVRHGLDCLVLAGGAWLVASVLLSAKRTLEVGAVVGAVLLAAVGALDVGAVVGAVVLAAVGALDVGAVIGVVLLAAVFTGLGSVPPSLTWGRPRVSVLRLVATVSLLLRLLLADGRPSRALALRPPKGGCGRRSPRGGIVLVHDHPSLLLLLRSVHGWSRLLGLRVSQGACGRKSLGGVIAIVVVVNDNPSLALGLLHGGSWPGVL